MAETAELAANPMLGSQLVSKSIIGTPQRGANTSWGQQSQQQEEQPAAAAAQQVVQQAASGKTTDSHEEETNNNNSSNPQATGKSTVKSLLLSQPPTQEAHMQQLEHRPLEATSNGLVVKENNNGSLDNNTANGGASSKDFELLVRETQELKIKTRRLQLEVDEKNEIISVLKDELETTKEQNDKFQRDNIQLLKDSKRVKFLQDENDFLQDKVGSVDKLELEIKRLKEKLNELDFLKLRIGELDEDKTKAQTECAHFEDKWKRAEAGLGRIPELEAELNKWKLFSHELETEKNSIQGKLLESIEQETKLNSINKQVEDEVRRLRSLIKSYEEQREEEQASNSLIMSVADLKQLDQQSSKQQQHDYSSDINGGCDPSAIIVADSSSIKFELDKQLEKELNEENKELKQKLDQQEADLVRLKETNQEIRDDLESNKKLIADLRQDLACEKSLAIKLTKQLANFTKQIKNLDRQYFPIHDDGSSSAAAATLEKKFNGNEKKESSPILNGSTSTTFECSQQLRKDALLDAKQEEGGEVASAKSINDELQGNNSDGNNETKQQVNIKSGGSKLSAQAEQGSTKPHHNPQLDNGIKPASKQTASITQGDEGKKQPVENGRIQNLLSIATEQTEVRCSALKSAVTNKSTADLKSSADDRREDESSGKGRLLSEAATNNNIGSNLAANAETLPQASHNRSGSARKPAKLLLNDSEDELRVKRRHVGANNNSNINTSSHINNSNNGDNSGSNVHHLTSVSPSSNAPSQSSSPSAAITIGHDSGFQSINNDFNQISPPNAEARKTLAAAARASSFASEETPTAVAQSTARPPNRSTPINSQQHAESTTAAAATTPNRSVDRTSAAPTPTRSGDKVPNASKDDVNLVVGRSIDRSQKQAANITVGVKPAAHSTPSNISATAPSSRPAGILSSSSAARSSKAGDTGNLLNGRSLKKVDDDSEEEEDTVPKGPTRAPTPVKSRSSTSVSNFVRNSLPSRSVNFGHSKSSAYLDRIRASVTATAITNTTSSFKEQTQNVMLTQHNGNRLPESINSAQYVLNCMLDHSHSDRCFVDARVAQGQASQIIAGDHHHHQHPHYPHHHHHLNRTDVISPIQSSRQLNALIDPVSHEHLMMSMLHRQSHDEALPQQPLHTNHLQRPYAPAPFDNAKLTEQQIAHLASLHHQHYYHHLQHLHQLHQLHHLHMHHHRVHHKYDPQAAGSNNAEAGTGPTATTTGTAAKHNRGQRQQPDDALGQHQQAQRSRQQHQETIYSGGSQFYAPSVQQYDQIYANMAPNSNDSSMSHANEHHHRTRLVNSINNTQTHHHHQQQQQPHQRQQHPEPPCSAVKTSPGRPNAQGSPPRSMHQSNINHHVGLPQIDEVNGLPSVNTSVVSTRSTPTKQQRKAQLLITSDAISNQAKQHTLPNSSHASNNGSPTSSSSSPTSSSASSNLSPSSASSSSSLNSLSASSAPLNRSALRHTTTNMNKRQFSVERELISALPMTATLSRVGSCRGANGKSGSTGEAQVASSVRSSNGGSGGHQMQADIGQQMRTAVKSQQPPMRTSKILSIGQQSAVAQVAVPSVQHRHHQQQPPNQVSDEGRRTCAEARTGTVDRLASNLANIRLKDGLAFASLRAPKGSVGMRSTALAGVNNNGQQSQPPTPSSKITATASGSLERRKQQQGAGSANNDNGNGGKSSVWFEYGCV